MAFADLAKSHATFIAGHVFGESIGYRSWPATTWTTVNAVVQRQPVDPVGEVLQNVIQVFVSKAAVPSVRKGKDHVRLTLDEQVGSPPEIFTVVKVTESRGGWSLECSKK